MNKNLKVIIVSIIVVVMILGVYFLVKNNAKKKSEGNIMNDANFVDAENVSTKMNAIVLRVNDNSLDVMIGSEEERYVNNVMFSKEGNIGFKEGQEVLIYYNSSPEVNFPGQITDVGKIEIVKEESGVTIPDEISQMFKNSSNSVENQ